MGWVREAVMKVWLITLLHRDHRQTDRPRWVTKQLGEERTGTIIQEPFLETLKYLGNFLITPKRTVLDEPTVTKSDVSSDRTCYDERTEFILDWKRMLVLETGTFSMI